MSSFADNYLEFLDDSIAPTTFNNKVLVIAGEKSDYISHETAGEFKKIFPSFNSEQDIKWIQDAGHLVHLEKPYEFINLVHKFIQEWSIVIINLFSNVKSIF